MTRKRLGMRELESRVMLVLWNSPDSMSPRRVRDALRLERDLAYTTVMTILVRLLEKGMVTRARVGRAYAYRPVRSREEDSAARIQGILASANNRPQILASFLQALAPKERAQLLSLLQERLQK